jgi:hypothetical protein
MIVVFYCKLKFSGVEDWLTLEIILCIIFDPDIRSLSGLVFDDLQTLKMMARIASYLQPTSALEIENNWKAYCYLISDFAVIYPPILPSSSGLHQKSSAAGGIGKHWDSTKSIRVRCKWD